MGKGWKFVGKFKRGRKACLAIECIVAVPDPKEAKAIAGKKLIGADELTAMELSQTQIKALNLKEGDVRLRPAPNAPGDNELANRFADWPTCPRIPDSPAAFLESWGCH
jgi:hypothetical protein